MKIKFYLFAAITFILSAGSIQSKATNVTVNVLSLTFSPADFTISMGDTITWLWNNNAGNHTTTSVNIPVGALPWDENINHNATTFMYVPAVAGSYNYKCTFHASMGMLGHFTVTGSTGISSPSSLSLNLSAASPVSSEMAVHYQIPNTTRLSIQLYDIIGNKVQELFSSWQNAGTYSNSFHVDQLHKGIYILRLVTEENTVSQRILIQ